MLHIVNKSPFEKGSLQSCLSVAKADSAVLLFEDGVYGALKGSSVSAQIQDAMSNVKFYALESDIKLRGIADKVMDGIEIVDYAKFVDLAATSSKVNSWV